MNSEAVFTLKLKLNILPKEGWKRIGLLPGTAVKALRSLRIEVGPAALWYVPFDNRGRELVNLLTGVRYDWAAFRGVRH